jgi:hypothetical protein
MSEDTMWTKTTALFLWCAASSSVLVVGTQAAARSWLAVSWVVASLGLAIFATVMYRLSRARRKRWHAGEYD